LCSVDRLLRAQHGFYQKKKYLCFTSAGNGEVDFEEFLSLMKKQMKDMDPEAELRELFQVFDMNSDGKIR
jgi:Ca2+-binding EF-hand superfamily protein